MMWLQVQNAWKLKYIHCGWHSAWLIDWLCNTGVCGNVVTVSHNTTINLTCTTSDGRRTPGWFVNETYVDSEGDIYTVSTSTGMDKTTTLTINGNLSSETVNVYCEVITTELQFVYMHNTTLRFQGWLDSIIWQELLQQCIVNQLYLYTSWHSQVAFPHLKTFISKSTLTPQSSNGNLLTLQWTMTPFM